KCRCISPTPTHPGNVAPTKTPTGCSASTFPKAPKSPTTKPTSTAWPPNSTTDHAVSSATEPQQKSSPTSWPLRLLPSADTKVSICGRPGQEAPLLTVVDP